MIEPIIDRTVDKKIDAKIEQAQLSTIEPPLNKPSNTTIEDDLRSKGQRDLNLKWEGTQQFLAVFVVIVTMTTSSIIVMRSIFYGVSDANLATAAYTFLSSTTSLVVGFYFSRTNHARIGDDPQKKSGGGLDDR